MALATLILGIFGVLFAGVAALGVLRRLWLVPDLRMHATPGIRYEPTPLGDGTLCYVRLALVNVGRAAAEGWGVRFTVPLPENGVGSVDFNGVTDVDSAVRTSAKTVSRPMPNSRTEVAWAGEVGFDRIAAQGSAYQLREFRANIPPGQPLVGELMISARGTKPLTGQMTIYDEGGVLISPGLVAPG